MCGIIGYFSKGATRPDRNRLDQATEMMHHRGPDASGAWLDDRAGFGFRRLSIIDLSTGNQPMSTEDGKLHIVFNGEIYNYRELRAGLEAKGFRFGTQSDTEVILKLFLQKGARCVEDLRGMFAFAIYDSSRGTLFLARDRLGKKPLVYAETSHGFYFASEIKPLLHLSELPRVVDHEAAQAYLTFRYIPREKTIWRNCFRLPRASRMFVEHGSIKKVEPYWTFPDTKSVDASEDECLEKVRSAFEDSVRLRLISDVPLGAFLSGGVDSSVTVAAMKRLQSNVQTFSIGFEDSKFDESKYAREASERIGTTHHELRVAADSLDSLHSLIEKSGEPFADQSLLVTHLLSKFTRSNVTVALSGDGGDELFSGYKRYVQLAKAWRLNQSGLAGLKIASSFIGFKLEQLFNPGRRGLRWPRSAIDRILPMGENEQAAYLLSSWNEGLRPKLWTGTRRSFSATGFVEQRLAALKSSNSFSKWQQLDLDLYLCDDILRKVDIASMAASLECRCPFLDHKLIEVIASLPQRYVADASNQKYLLKHLYPEIFPAGFFDREKKGFSMPIGSWMKKQWKDEIGNSINLVSNNGMERVIDRNTLKFIWTEHLEGREDHGDRLWTWHVLSKWNEIFKPDWEG